jgi:endonuclease-3
MDGTYTLLVRVPTRHRIEVGALGTHTFDPGWYAYTGSAFGPGGLSRVDRHRELAAGDRDVRHWHVDYLLGLPDASVDTVVTTGGEDIECRVAQAIDGERVPAFGCSDCACDSHLVGQEDRAPLLESVRVAHGRFGQNPPSQ